MSARFSLLAVWAASLLTIACSIAPHEAPATVTASTAWSDEASPHAGGSAAAATPLSSPAAVELWRTRCNQCHTRVEPSTRDRATLALALERHRKRARLSDSDVQGLLDFLAKAPGRTTSASGK